MMGQVSPIRSLQRDKQNNKGRREKRILFLCHARSPSDSIETLDLSCEHVDVHQEQPSSSPEMQETAAAYLERSRAKVRSITDDALQSVQRGVREDPRIALQFLKQTNFLKNFADGEHNGTARPVLVVEKMDFHRTGQDAGPTGTRHPHRRNPGENDIRRQIIDRKRAEVRNRASIVRKSITELRKEMRRKKEK